jgi:3-oxoacyl-[acyl-carrier protein] reductase
MTSPPLHNHVALVTGGSRGIGAAVVRSLAGAGAAVVINYRQSADAAQSLVTAIEKEGGRAIAIGADVAQNDAVVGMFDRAAQAFGPVDILVNNAGIAITRNIDDLTEADFDRTIEVNLKSVFLCTKAALPAMRRKHYNASKAGIEGLTRGYAARLVKEGITVNAVAPSLIETDMMKDQQALVARIPLGRFGKSDEVAQGVMSLIGNAYMTGQTIALSGGMAFN